MKYIDDLTNALWYFVGLRRKTSADDAIRIIRVNGIVTQSRDKMMGKEGVETRNEVLDRHIWHLFLYHRLILALRHL